MYNRVILQGHGLVFCTGELLFNHLEDKTPVDWKTQSIPCLHDWVGQDSEEPFISKLTGLWQMEYGLSSAEQYTEVCQQLRTSDTPPTTANTSPKQVMRPSLIVC